MEECSLFFHPMDFLIIIAFGLSIWAQFRVQGTFNKWSHVQTRTGMSGAEVARSILDQNGLGHIPIRPIRGKLSDHYDPINKVVCLSEEVFYGRSISSISVAAHETGHAIQHKEGYAALMLRHRMFPVTRFASGIAPILLIVGFILQSLSLIGVGIIFFSAAVAFQLVTLPVEFNASSRARALMISEGILYNDEENGVKKVLGAAALTYVAAALISMLELLKYVMIFTQSNDD